MQFKLCVVVLKRSFTVLSVQRRFHYGQACNKNEWMNLMCGSLTSFDYKENKFPSGNTV